MPVARSFRLLGQSLSLTALACSWPFLPSATGAEPPRPAQRVAERVGFLGAPCHPHVEWNDANVGRMKELGFNVMQLNIAWGYRPNDEPLNLEDVIALPEGFAPTPGDKDRAAIRTPEKIAARAETLRHRIALCRKFGMKTIFHFGAPNVLYPPLEPDVLLDQCISNETVTARTVALVKAFHEAFPGVDHLLCYTYDQHAWLCSEAGNCPRCRGVPLHERVTPFVNAIGRTWQSLQPQGVVYWEPWELSAGQTYRCAELIDASCVGLALHSNIAEVQVALPADRWFRNMLTKAAERQIRVLAEVWTGSPTEEMEPYIHIAVPLATLRALRAVNNAGPLQGIKEYYGNVPDKEDPNLRMTGIFFANPDISDTDALEQLARPYAAAAEGMVKFWTLSSEAIEMYPWDVSWLSREVGRSDPDHLLTAAALKGASWQTPSWQSSRRTAFLRTDHTAPPNFWMREDNQLRFEQTAAKLEAALLVADTLDGKIPDAYAATFRENVKELRGLRRRVLAYAYHLRETNLADLLRGDAKQGLPVNRRTVDELRSLMLEDQANMEKPAPLAAAIAMLDADLPKFLETYFLPTGPSGKKEGWTITSE